MSFVKSTVRVADGGSFDASTAAVSAHVPAASATMLSETILCMTTKFRGSRKILSYDARSVSEILLNLLRKDPRFALDTLHRSF
jgi:hypothetical protein